MHLDAGYDSTTTRDLLDELGCRAVISKKGFPLQAGARRVVERPNAWHSRGFAKLLVCTERRTRVIDAFIALANAVIVIRRLLRTAWTTHRWQPDQADDYEPIGGSSSAVRSTRRCGRSRQANGRSGSRPRRRARRARSIQVRAVSFPIATMSWGRRAA